MQGFKYFLVVLTAVAGLSVATRLVYLRHPVSSSEASVDVPAAATPPAAPTVAPAEKPAEPTASRAPRTTSRKPASSPAPVVRKSRQVAAPSPNARISIDSAHGVVEPMLPPMPVIEPITVPVEPPVWQASPRQIVRDSAYAMTTSGRLQAAISVLDGWMKAHPSDTAVGLDLARLRARTGDYAGSIAQYSALIEQHRTPQFLFERGQTYLWSGNSRRGEADLLESEKLSPRAETERQLGDHYRWQGDFARSASWYRKAQRKAPGDTTVLASMRLLDQAIEARLRGPGELTGGDFGSGMSAVSDNAGFDLYALRLSQAFDLPTGSVLTLSGEMRSATGMSGTGIESQLEAMGFDAAVARRFGATKLTMSVGMLDHGDESPIVRGAVAADGFLGSARLRASVRRTPAYESLWAPRMLGVAGSPATAWQSQGSLSLPVGGAAELYAMGELLTVSDDNTRTAFQLAMRRRLPLSLSLVYAGSMMSYEQQTALYYSPARYVSQSLGLEWSKYREQGVSFALRATPGYAWIREPAGTADSTSVDLTAFQFTTGLELGYRRGAWDLLLSTGLSSGREGGYRSQNALLYLRRSW